MVHRCFAYVVLASIISSRVIAAPIAQASESPSMCSDLTKSWEEKIDICDICTIPNLPRKMWNRYCGVDSPETHEKAQGVNRRDAAGSVLHKDGEEDVEFHTAHPTGDAVTADGTKATNSEASEDGAANAIVEKPEHQDMLNEDAVNHKPASGVWRRQQQQGHPHPHRPTTHQQANGIIFAYPPAERKKREANPVPALKGQSEAKFFNDVVIHKPVTGVWRRLVPITLPSAPIVHPQAADVSEDDGEIPAGTKKREAGPLPPPEFFEDGTPIEGPVPFPHPHILPRQSSGASEAGMGDEYTKYEKNVKAVKAPNGIVQAYGSERQNSDTHRRGERVRAREWIG